MLEGLIIFTLFRVARKTKCDGQHPTCQSCARRSLPCSYATDAAVTSGSTPGIGPLRGRRAAQLAAAQQQQTFGQQDEQDNGGKTSDDQRTASPSNSRRTGSRSPPIFGSATPVVGASEGGRDGGGKRGFESPLALHPAPGGRTYLNHEAQNSPGLHALAALASASASASASVSARSSPPALSSASSSTSLAGLTSLSMSGSTSFGGKAKISNAPTPTTPSSAMALPRSSSKRALDEDDFEVAESGLGGRRGVAAGRNATTTTGSGGVGSVLGKDGTGADSVGIAATSGSGATRSPSGSKTSEGGSHPGGAGSPPLPPSNKKVKYDEEARLVGIGASA